MLTANQAGLGFDVLMYVNTFYLMVLIPMKIFSVIYKYISKPENFILNDFLTCLYGIVIETLRNILAKRGSLADKNVPSVIAALLTLPAAAGIGYLCFLESASKIDYLFFPMLFLLQLAEIGFAILFAVSLQKPISYD